MLGGGGVLVLCGIATGELSGFSIAHVSRASWTGWIYLVTFGSLVGFTAYVFLLKAVSPAKASTYAYVNPVVAVIGLLTVIAPVALTMKVPPSPAARVLFGLLPALNVTAP